MTSKFQKDILKVVVGQICQTIGWNAINSSALEVLIDVMHRYVLELTRTTHLFTDLFGRTQPNLDDLGLAFNEMGINIDELREYVEFVDSVPCNLAVPKYPFPKENHLNFLKPGSQEVMTRPVHVNEHLPPTIELSVETSNDLGGSPQPSPTFKRPGEPIETGSAKRARLGLEEEGRPLREISSVMMTTGGFISPAREGKLPEPRLALPASDLRSISPPLYSSAPPEVIKDRERDKEKKKRPPDVVREKEKEKRKEKRLHGEHGVKKLAGMKEMSKLKAFKPNVSKQSTPSTHSALVHPVTPEKSLIQKLAESPHLVVTPVPAPQPPPPAVKLATEPDKQKLNIFKKISKVKEDEPAPLKEDPLFSSPGSPSTPKTPEILKSPILEQKKKKKDKDREKKKRHRDVEKIKEVVDVERRPKTPDIPISLPPPSFFFPPGLVPPVISNPLIPRFPMPLGPNFPNLPIPPSFLHQPKPDVTIEPIPSTSKSPLAILMGEKKDKEHKKDKKEKKKKKDKDKDRDVREKPKKEKKEKKHSEDKQKSKDKKEKKEKRKEKEREKEKVKEPEISVPKITVKLANPTPSSSRSASPRRTFEDEPKRPPPTVIEEPPRKEKHVSTGEIARISSLFSKPHREETKPLTVQTDAIKLPKEPEPLKKSPGTVLDKDGNEVWICPSCGRPDDGTPMIGCDECDAWYHWVCVGIQVPPDESENWYCRFCILKKQNTHSKKKRGRKKKPPV